MTYLAAIDCGTNSIRLLIAQDQGADKPLRQVEREMRIVRLGEGIDRTGRISVAALQRTFAAIDEYAQLIGKYPVEKIRFVGTSASRDAQNRDEYFAGVKERLGVPVEVVTGETEANLSFTGATSSFDGLLDPILLVDIGGGSTEFVVGRNGRVLASFSTDMGSVRIFERFFAPLLEEKGGNGAMNPLDPEASPGIGQAIFSAVEAIDQLIGQANSVVDFARVRNLVGVAGTVTTITAQALGLESYQPEKIHRAKISVSRTLRACNQMMNLPTMERAALGFMPEGRADVIGAGALIWARIIDYLNGRLRSESKPIDYVYTSEFDILDGIALSIAPSRKQ